MHSPAESLSLALLADGEVVAEGLGSLTADWPDAAVAVSVRAEDGAGQVASLVLAYPELEALEFAQVSDPAFLIEPAQGCSCDATGPTALLWLLPLLLVARRRSERCA